MIMLLVGFSQTSNDIKSRATGTARPRSGVSTLPTVNFRTNPDFATTVDQHTTNPSAPKVAFESLDATSSASETTPKMGDFKTEVIDLGRRVSTNSEKNV